MIHFSKSYLLLTEGGLYRAYIRRGPLKGGKICHWLWLQAGAYSDISQRNSAAVIIELRKSAANLRVSATQTYFISKHNVFIADPSDESDVYWSFGKFIAYWVLQIIIKRIRWLLMNLLCLELYIKSEYFIYPNHFVKWSKIFVWIKYNSSVQIINLRSRVNKQFLWSMQSESYIQLM